MAINSLHPQYQEVLNSIVRTTAAVKGDVQQFVPRLSGQSQSQYDAYVNRTSYYNVIERTLAALIGALTRRPSTIEMVVGDDPTFANVSDQDDFIRMCYADLMMTGRTGILVDFDDVNQRPYITSYDGMSIINWGDGFYVLAETYYAPNPKDRYEQMLMVRYRELYLDDNGLYAVRIWEQKKTAAGNYSNAKPVYEVVQYVEPTIRGQRLTWIPFVVAGCGGANICSKPLLSTLADINIDYFKIAVDIAHGAHFIALPTPYIAGDLQNEQQVVRVGTDEFIHLAPGGQVGYLEFTGAGMNFLMEYSKTKEEQMYSLGSRLLSYKKGVESSDALQLRLGAEAASLVTVADALEEALGDALYWYNLWMGMDVEPEVELNKDVSPTAIDPQQITALLTLFQKGVISLDTLLQRLYEGEIVDDVSEEKEMITGIEESDEMLEAQVEGPESEMESEEEIVKAAIDATVRARAQ